MPPAVLRTALRSRVDSVLIGAALADDPVVEVWGRTAAVVLAAGQAKRFGVLKQVLPWQGVPLVAHVAQQAQACLDIDHVIVTTGASSQQVAAPLTGGRSQAHHCRRRRLGERQSRSVRRRTAGGAGRVGTLSGALFLLADQPGVSTELLSALVQRHRDIGASWSRRDTRASGNPVLFDRRTFAEFSTLTGDVGARRSFAAMKARSPGWIGRPRKS